MPGGLLEGLPGHSADVKGGGVQDAPGLYPRCLHAEGPVWGQSLWDWVGGWWCREELPLTPQGHAPHLLALAFGGEGLQRSL